MADNPNFSDTSLPVRDVFIVSGDYVVDADKVVAVSSVYPCTETMTNMFTVLLRGGHKLEIAAEKTYPLNAGLHEIFGDDGKMRSYEKQKKDTEGMRKDFLCQWRSRRTNYGD